MYKLLGSGVLTTQVRADFSCILLIQTFIVMGLLFDSPIFISLFSQNYVS